MLTVTPKAIASIKNAPIRYIIPRLLAYCGPTDELYKKQINRFRKIYQYYLNISVTKKKKKRIIKNKLTLSDNEDILQEHLSKC